MASVTAPTRKSAEDPSPAREVPAPDVLLRATADVAHKSLPDEQVLRVTEIQGNIRPPPANELDMYGINIL